MADLRALLGDRYVSMIEKAANAICGGRYGGRVTRFSRAQLNALDVRDADAALAAVLPDLLADVWDEGHADGLHNAHEYREHRKTRNPYRPETTAGEATCAPVTLAASDAINPPPDPSGAVTCPHNTEGANR